MPENQNGQYLILPEGASRILGREAQRQNIMVAYAVAGIVKTTLGPMGMDKMLISELGDIVITNDGATILDEMKVDHPVARIMVEIAKTQDKEVGDGTTTAVILAGELLKSAGNLLEQGIHPTIVVKGYKDAAIKAKEILVANSSNISIDDTDKLERIAVIAMSSKNIGGDSAKKHLAKLAIMAVKQVATVVNGKTVVDHDFIKVEKKEGGSIEDTEFINGVLVDKEIAHPGMPKSTKNAKIALLDVALEIEKTETDARIEITSPDQMQAFLAQEEKMLKDMVEKISKSGANVVFIQKGIDDVAQHYLAKNGITAVRRVKKSDMEKLAKATGARLVTSLDDLEAADLGFAGMVEERKIAGEQMVFVEKCKDPKSVTIFARGSTPQVVNEVERSLNDVIGAVSSAAETGKYVIGGGAIEIDIATGLREYAIDVGGKEQLAIHAFADAMEVVPKTLTENAGGDPIDVLVKLRQEHKKKSGKVFGVDIYKESISDMEKQGVIEPLKVKMQAISSASEAAEIILRIDDMISSRSRGGPAGGMGPHPGEME